MSYLKVRVVAGIDGWAGDSLRVRVRAAAERGKANAALRRFLARSLGVSPSLITIARGAGSRDKLISVEGLTEEELHRKLGQRHP